MGANYSRSELASGSFVWVVLIEYASREFLFASSHIDQDDMPSGYSFAGLLAGDSLDFTQESDILSPSSSGLSFSFPDIVFPVDISSLVEEGFPFSAAIGELSLWKVGESFDNRQVIARGPVSDPWYGAEGEPISLSIEENPFDDSVLFPSSLQVVSSETVIAAGTEGAVGEYYPMIFGNPGVFLSELGDEKAVAGSNAPIRASVGGATSNIVIAGHAIELPVSLIVVNSDGDSVTFTSTHASAPINIEVDNLGNEITTCNLGTASTDFKSASEFYCRWDGSGARGLMSGESRAGRILEFLLVERSSLRVDAGRMAIAAKKLNDYLFDFQIQDSASVWEFIDSEMIPLLPISFLASSEGIYPVVWDLEATPKDARIEIVAGIGGAIRESSIKYERTVSDVRNDLRINFALNKRSGEYKRFRNIRPVLETSAGSFVEATSALARRSADLYGIRSDTFDTDIVYDDATAQKILNWKLRANGFLHRSVNYRVDREIGGWLSPGDVVTLTDDELSISSRVCLVRSVKWISEREVILELLILDFGD
jgi:hypothetical protein